MTLSVAVPRPIHDDEDQLGTLKKEMLARRTQRGQIEQMLHEFTDQLFGALEANIQRATANGVPNFGKPRRIAHPAGEWRQALQIYIEDWSVIFVPLVGWGWPNPRDEAKLVGARFKEPCGRIAAFWGDEPGETSFYDFLIFADGLWFAWGYGWPRTQDNLESTDFAQITMDLLISFIREIHTTWRPRSDTTLGYALDARKRVYRFGRPGEE